MSDTTTGTAALHALRRTRQRRRLGDIEWFDAAYRAYLVGLFGGGAVLWASGAIGQGPVSAATAASIAGNGPRWLGLIACLAVLTGLRSGAQGGPLALEPADVAMVMLAPVDRRIALRKPAVQKLRSAVALGVAVGAIAGQLAGRRLPGTALAWAAGGALFGLTIGLLLTGTALVAHGTHLPRPAATAIGLTLLAWQIVAVARHGDGVPGPADTVGSLGLWGWRQRGVDVIPIVLAVGLAIGGLVLVGRTSLEALARRAALVSQLRFAVTMQDLRTVILLRRQLNQESSRSRPWVRIGAGRAGGRMHPVVRRGLHGISRFPLTRLVRMLAIAAIGGAALGLAGRGATAAVVVGALAMFLLGLETSEPLSQEIDQPNYTDSFPTPRADIITHHLLAPLVLLVPLAVVAAASAFAAVRHTAALWPIAIVALPATLAGACGGVVSVVRDAPDQLSANSTQAFMPPEMAGFGSAIRLVWPLLVSLVGVAPTLFVRAAYNRHESLVAGAVRGAVAEFLIVALVVFWVRQRDAIRARFRQFMNEGRNYDPNRPLPGVSAAARDTDTRRH